MKILKDMDISIANINGYKYVSVNDFAKVTNRKPSQIHQLIREGNHIRKLRCKRILNKPFIPIEELTEFYFTCNNGKLAYHYNEDGNPEFIEGYFRNDK